MSIKTAEVLKNFSLDSSIHGVNNFFSHRKWLIRLMWILIFFLSLGVCTYYVISVFREHVMKQPTVTSVSYVTHDVVKFPNVLICPTMPNQTGIEQFFPPGLKSVFTFIINFAENPLFAGIRHELLNNSGDVYEKYSGLELQWRKLLEESDYDPTIHTLYGNSQNIYLFTYKIHNINSIRQNTQFLPLDLFGPESDDPRSI